jgi:TPR repeat protein
MKKLSKIFVCLAVLGGISSCFADAYQEGENALKNNVYSEAAASFEKACDSGNAQGCFQLGALYEQGVGVVQNKYKAVALYAQACNGGESHGCSNMAMTYDTP